MRCFLVIALVFQIINIYGQDKSLGFMVGKDQTGVFIADKGTYVTLSGATGSTIITQDSSVHQLQSVINNLNLLGLEGYSINNTLTASFVTAPPEGDTFKDQKALWKSKYNSTKSAGLDLTDKINTGFGEVALVKEANLPDISFTFNNGNLNGIIINRSAGALWISSSHINSNQISGKASNGQDYFYQSYAFYLNDQKENALKSFDKYLSLNNSDKNAYHIAIELSLDLNDTQKAKVFLNRLLDQYPNDQQALLKRIELNLESERYSDVVNDINKLSNPADSLILIRARSNFQLNRKEDAIRDYSAVISKFVNLSDYENYTLALIDQNDPKMNETALKAAELGTENLIILSLAGKYWIDEKRYDEGIIMLEKVLNEKPGDQVILEYLARASYNSKNWEKAIKYYDALQEKRPLNAEEAYNAGEAFLTLGMTSKAIEMWNKAAGAGYSGNDFYKKKADLELQSGDSTAASADYKQYFEITRDKSIAEKIAIIEFGQKNNDLALEWAKKAIESGSTDPQMNLIAGISSYELNKKDEAYDFLTSLRNGNTLSGKGHYYLGLLMAEKELYSDALTQLNKAKDSGYKATNLDRLLMELNYQAGNYQEAIRFATEVINDDADNSNALITRGLSYYQLADKDRSFIDLKAAGSSVQKEPRALELLALLAVERNDEDAEKYVNAAISNGIEKSAYFMYLADLNESRGEKEKATQNLEKVISLGNGNAQIYLRLAELYYDVEDYGKAVANYDKGISEALNDVSIVTHYSLALVNTGKTDAARNQLEKAVSLESQNPSVYYHLGVIYIADNKANEALEVFSQAEEKGLNSEELYTAKGNAYLLNNSYEQALSSFNKALTINSDFLPALNGRAKVQLELGNYEKALADALKIQEAGNSDAVTYSIIGRSLFNLGKYDEALDPLTKAINGGINNGMLYGYRAIVNYKTENCDEAETDITVAINKGFNSPALKGAKGGCLFRNNEYADALPLLMEAKEEGFSEASVNKKIGISFYHTGEYENANKFLEEALEDLPEDKEIPYILGNSYFRAEYYEKAVIAYEEAASRSNQDPLLYNNLGKALEKDNKPGAALDAYDKAIELDKQYARAFENRGVLNIQMKNFEEGIEDLLFAEQLNGGKLQGELYVEIAEAYDQLERYGAAISYYEIAINNGAGGPEQLTALGDVLIETESFRDAISRYSQAININKEYLPAYSSRALAHMYLGNNQAAVEDLNVILANDPDNANARYNRGYLMEQLGNFEAAISDYNKFIENNPEDDQVVFDRANAYFSLESYSEALKDYNKAIEINPDNGKYYRGKGSSLYQLEDSEKACEAWQKGKELGDRESAFYLKQYCE
ncbi:tetratricopeptide repeat protein [Mangrovivirga sp. M17]|uniref:Tetratricopeptide repeat protein n=1 Tax=Mangrovivirga halotolerans TaxID=2993936 RepID=A0ABT3RMS3_9BACT|nr:tetratricopeptide repeat protein [Mangrovivirga halotolerans]MCX2742902.1 tetratricopeptide repeat protein [Mangrovivirga halotolerans]